MSHHSPVIASTKSFTIRAFTTLLLICATLVLGQQPERDDPDVPSPLDLVINKVMRSDDLAFNALSKQDQTRTIRRLKDRIYFQDKSDDKHALAVGEVLVRLHAEQPLHDLIVDLSKEGFAIDREIMVTFHALSFMKSKATVRMLVSFLYDKQDLAFREQVHRLEAMDEKEKVTYLNAHPKLQRILSTCNGTGNIAGAEDALFRMNLPGAPKLDPVVGQKEDLQKWRHWWEINKEKYKDDGPLPRE
jgi:hypothetical protein